MQPLFSYGTLQKETVQQDLFKRKLKGAKDILRGYKIEIIEITDEKFLTKDEGRFQKTITFTNNPDDFIEGTILELTEEELSAADHYEPANYKRIRMKFESGKEAWIYSSVVNSR